MRARPIALLAVLALTGGLTACGADDESASQVPKTAPDLTIPTATSNNPAAAADTNATTVQTTTSTTPAAGNAPPAAAPPAAPPPAATGSPTTGGQSPAGQGTTPASPGGGAEFENFCAQNPGAC